ncbi:MAG: Gmad2 immunoglobulin-like domain-containing protein [Propioniciclava sp.]
MALVMAAALTGCGMSPPATTPGVTAPTVTAPTVTAPRGTATPTTDLAPVLVYFPRDSSRGIRLGREERRVPAHDRLRGALIAMLDGPVDPDYIGGWPAGTQLLGVSTAAQVTTVDLSEEARVTSVGSEAAALAVAQLVWTVTEIQGADTEVMLTIAGVPADELWGVLTWDEPRARGAAVDDRVLVSIDAPLDGAAVTSPVTILGDAAVFEATLPWRISDLAGTVVAEGWATTAVGQEFSEYSVEVVLAPGEYVIEVAEADVSGGEGRAADTDTRRITVVRYS